ncbi:MAG: molybdopterin-guanine dinucleotide biosynthesis protein B, partial [Candidatus Methanomethylicaceae archaeon]
MKIICIISLKSGYGKTTLIEEIIKKLTKKGLKICAIKHSSHNIKEDYGKDTWRFRNAGAMASAIISNEGIIYLSNANLTIPLISLMNPDLIICEGFKESNYPKLIIIKDENELNEINKINNIIGIISSNDLQNINLPILKNIDEIVNFIISMVNKI